MSQKYDDLVKKLREIFQIDKPDLDFGIYRIINQRATQIDHYLRKTLREKVETEIGKRQSADSDRRRNDLITQLREEFGNRAFDYEGNLTGADALASDLGKQLAELDKGTATNAEHENAVFSHLLIFFSRYYDKGDFISQRRYKGDTYAIPYSGEEVMLHWANKDQYYIKSGENFSNYTFKLDDGRKVHFRLVAADTAKDNRKDNDQDRRFALVQAKIVLKTDDDGEEYEETITPIEELEAQENDKATTELVLRFEYIQVDKKTKQEALIAQALERVFADTTVKARWLDLSKGMPTETNPQRTVLEKYLNDYTSKNTSDYFIHKDLDRFLRNELDFYIKNEVMHLDDVQEAEKFADIEKNLSMIQCFRAIGWELIRFLSQIENFQKKLWLKKKFVVETNYCITLDRVPEELYPEIAANEAQREEWVKLFAIDEIEASTVSLAYSEPLVADFLKTNDKLLLDTKFFDVAFKARLLQAIENFDAQCDGLLVHSENFQALNTLQDRYREQVNYIHIDPPYNTKTSGFLYKNAYRHSSWLSLMEDRIAVAEKYLAPSSVYACHIDEYEFERLKLLLDNTQTDEAGVMIWNKGMPNTGTIGLANQHEYVIFRTKENASIRVKKKNLDDISTRIRELLRKHGNASAEAIKDYRAWLKSNSSLSKAEKTYDQFDKFGRAFRSDNMSATDLRNNEKFYIPLKHPIIGKDCPVPSYGWRYTPTSLAALIDKDLILFGDDETKMPRKKTYLDETSSSQMSSVYNSGARGKVVLDSLGLVFPFAHSVEFYSHIIETSEEDSAIVLDFFGGSGTTGHAVISLNRSSSSMRKYILFEMGEHFEATMRPRMMKVVYSDSWKDGKPTRRDSGISHCFKYIRLESYEDVLNNLELKRDNDHDLFADEVKQDYLLNYMLDVESKGSLLSVDDFKKPFDYTLKISADSAGAYERKKVDLVETFNYLIGLRVKHIDADIESGYVAVEGTLPSEERCLVLWRDCEQLDYEGLRKLCEKLQINPKESKYDVIYINGDHNIPDLTQESETESGITRALKLRQIEPEFLQRMFDVEDV